MTPRQADVVTSIALLALLVTVAMTAPRWAAALRVPAVDGEEGGSDAGGGGRSRRPAKEAARRIHVRLYFEAAGQDRLLGEEREIAFSSDLAEQLRTVVEELAKGPTVPGLLPTLPPGTKVLEVFVRAGGVAYVDLSSEAVSGGPGGSGTELLTVYSLVNTIVGNFPAASRVRVLVNDEAPASFAGHVDLSRPLPPDMTLLAVPGPSLPAVP